MSSTFASQVDVVGIYANGGTAQGDFSQIFQQARPLKATVRETSRIFDHPIETGSIISDNQIINPVEIDIPLVVSSIYYAAIYSQLKQAFLNATALTVKTRVGIYANMIIADMPHDEDAEMYNAITIALHLKQVIYVTPQSASTQQPANYAPADPTNDNTVQSGQQQSAPIESLQTLSNTTVPGVW